MDELQAAQTILAIALEKGLSLSGDSIQIDTSGEMIVVKAITEGEETSVEISTEELAAAMDGEVAETEADEAEAE